MLIWYSTIGILLCKEKNDSLTELTLPQGANIVVDGTTLGTTTSTDGTFLIHAHAMKAGEYTIVASFVGYQSQRTTVGVDEDISSLDPAVFSPRANIRYNQQRR